MIQLELKIDIRGTTNVVYETSDCSEDVGRQFPFIAQTFAPSIVVEELPNSVKSAGWRSSVQETSKFEKWGGCKSAVESPNCVKSAVGQTSSEDVL